MPTTAAMAEIPNAAPGPISDHQLAEVRRVADGMAQDRLTQEGAALLVMCLSPLLSELAERRAAMGLLAELGGNVIALDGRRGA